MESDFGHSVALMCKCGVRRLFIFFKCGMRWYTHTGFRAYRVVLWPTRCTKFYGAAVVPAGSGGGAERGAR